MNLNPRLARGLVGVLVLCGSAAWASPVIYVDARATGANTGESWATAFNDLQAALAAAKNRPDPPPIWVAAGVYRPAPPGGDRSATFKLTSGITLYGGFAGNEAALDQRDPTRWTTVLSGDLNGDDSGGFVNYQDNSLHVVLATDTGPGTELNGFAIRGGSALGPGLESTRGGGLYAKAARLTISQCRFEVNQAGGAVGQGGGAFVEGGAVEFVDCTFLANRCIEGGGGLACNGNETIHRCRFIGNMATGRFGGGGLLVMASGDVRMSSCVFTGNLSATQGSTVYASGILQLSGCSIYGEVAEGSSALIRGPVRSIRNTIIWGDPAAAPALVKTASFSCIQGLPPRPDAGGNFGDPPRLVNPAGPDGLAGTEDDDLHLLPDSPCIAAGDPAFIAAPGELDIDGEPRVQHCRVDIGADETPSYGDCDGNGLADACQPGGDSDCNRNLIPDFCEADCNRNGIVDECDVSVGSSADLNANKVPDECEGPIIYVAARATGHHNGTNWTDAYTDLQSALAAAAGLPGIIQEIWVAAGTYRPAGPAGDRNATFRLRSGLALYGGFAGTESNPEQRDLNVNLSELSGDLNGDDEPGFVNITDNSLHVVTAESADSTCVLDGFVISRGNSQASTGAGMQILGGDPVIVNCTFQDNITGAHTLYTDGGGILCQNASPFLMNCRFRRNRAEGMNASGGGLSCHGGYGDPLLINCLFESNYANDSGGGIFCASGALTLANCTFVANTARRSGGGVALYSSPNWSYVSNSIFWANTDSTGISRWAQISAPQLGVDVRHSCVQGGWAGNGNIGELPEHDPSFLDPLNGDFRLAAMSPCVDAGNSLAVPLGVLADLAGLPRFVDDPLMVDTGVGPAPIVDMGAYEYQAPPRLMRALSVKTHAAAGAFGVNLEVGAAGGHLPVECRRGEMLSIVLTLSEPVVAVDGVLDGSEVVSSVGSVARVSSQGTQVAFTLDGVPNGSCVQIELSGIADLDGHELEAGPLRLLVLHGDVDGNGEVDEADIMAVKAQSGRSVSADTFREDVNTDGLVASGDITQVKSLPRLVPNCESP